MHGFTSMGRSHAHRDLRNCQYQMLSMIVGYIQVKMPHIILSYLISIYIKLDALSPISSTIFKYICCLLFKEVLQRR